MSNQSGLRKARPQPRRSRLDGRQIHPRFPPLEAERLALRDFQDGDASFLLGHWSDPAITEFMIVDPPITTLQQAQLIVDAFRNPGRDFHRWMFELKET